MGIGTFTTLMRPLYKVQVHMDPELHHLCPLSNKENYFQKGEEPVKQDVIHAEIAIPQRDFVPSSQDKKVTQVGLDHIYVRSMTLKTLKNWKFTLTFVGIPFDAAAFARYAQQEALEMANMTEASYVEERIEEDREFQAESLSDKDKEEEYLNQLKQIPIQRMDLA